MLGCCCPCFCSCDWFCARTLCGIRNDNDSNDDNDNVNTAKRRNDE